MGVLLAVSTLFAAMPSAADSQMSASANTASMPAGLRQFAEYNPFTPVTQTVRGLLTGGPVATHALPAIAWSAAIALVSYLWAVRLYNRRRAATPS